MKETPVPDFLLCEHPDLPGQTALMVNPRNGWTPVAPAEDSQPPGGEPDTSQPSGGEPDSPSAGTSTPTPDEE
jgi:hypothetical protein